MVDGWTHVESCFLQRNLMDHREITVGRILPCTELIPAQSATSHRVTEHFRGDS